MLGNFGFAPSGGYDLDEMMRRLRLTGGQPRGPQPPLAEPAAPPRDTSGYSILQTPGAYTNPDLVAPPPRAAPPPRDMSGYTVPTPPGSFTHPNFVAPPPRPGLPNPTAFGVPLLGGGPPAAPPAGRAGGWPELDLGPELPAGRYSASGQSVTLLPPGGNVPAPNAPTFTAAPVAGLPVPPGVRSSLKGAPGEDPLAKGGEPFAVPPAGAFQPPGFKAPVTPPFEPHFAPTNPNDYYARRWVETPEQAAVANQLYAFNSVAETLRQAAPYGPNWRDLTPQQLGIAATLSGQFNPAEAAAGRTAEAQRADLNRQAEMLKADAVYRTQIDQQRLQNVGALDVEKARASHARDPRAVAGAIKAQIAAQAANDPNFDPARLGPMFAEVDRMFPGGGPEAPGAAPPAPGTPPAPGAAPPAPGAAPPAPAAGGPSPGIVVGNVNKLMPQLAALVGGRGTPGRPDFKPPEAISVQQAEALVDTLAGAQLSPAEMDEVVRRVDRGELGNPVTVKEALTRAITRNYLMANPPAYRSNLPAGQRPPSYASGRNVPGLVTIQDPATGEKLFDIVAEQGETWFGRLGTGISAAYAGNPYNVATTPHGRVTLNPSDVEGLGPAGWALGTGGEQRKRAPERFKMSAALYKKLLNAGYKPPAAPPAR